LVPQALVNFVLLLHLHLHPVCISSAFNFCNLSGPLKRQRAEQ
jgi:hypothetical protein